MAPILPPDHKPLASPLDNMKIQGPAATLTITVTAYGLCPTTIPSPQVQATVGMIQAAQQEDDGVESTVAPMPFNWPVPRRRTLNPSQMTSSTNAALLYSGR